MPHYYLGIDDGYFSSKAKKERGLHKTVVVGVLSDNKNIVDVFIDFVSIDTLDAFTAVFKITEVSKSLYPQIEAVFLDGVTYAGFNIVDPRRLYILVGIPVITIFQHNLDLEKVFQALKMHFNDYIYRYRVISEVYEASVEVFIENTHNRLLIYPVGLEVGEAKRIVEKLSSDYGVPYPLRYADRFASMLGKIMFRDLYSPAS